MATYTYANDNNLCAQFPIATKEYTLTEIYDELRNMKERVAHSKAHVACAEADLTMYVKEHTLKDIQVDATEFHRLQKSRDERKADLELLTIALEGIRGAIRYYQAEALNKAYREVLPKYAGKQAGPKTREKFQNEVAQRLPGKARIYHNYMYSVSLYDDTLGLDNSFYANEDLYDTINRFNPEYQILTPSDSFSGHYPVDWVVWAVHVVEANKRIKEAFDKFYNESKSLSTSLCIGNTAMLSVSATDLKSR